jgi:hypothetical protein
MKKILLKLEENILIALSLIMIWGSIVYYLYSLNWLGTGITLVLSAASFYIRARFLQTKTETLEKTQVIPQKNWLHLIWPIVIYIILIASSFGLLLRSSSPNALISPWLVVSTTFFWLYAGATAWLIFVLNRQLQPSVKLWLLRIHYFLAFSVAVIIYQIGYGFDPFIHQATMELIDKQGYVLPKPFYYLGQYSLIVILHKLSGVSIYILNKILVPLLAALFLPGAIFSFVKTKGEPKRAMLVILTLLALPLNLFILSTPQNLTYLWLLLIIFYSLVSHLSYLPLILAIATLSIHPLGGMPALFFVAWIELLKRKDQLKATWYKLANIILWLGAALSLPLSFTIVTGQSWHDLSLSFKGLLSVFSFSHTSTNLSNFVLNFPYLINNNWLIIFVALVITGFIIWFKQNKNEAALLIKMVSAILVGFLLSASLTFTFLIDYERDNYISRLPVLMGLLALPALIIATNYLTTKAWCGSKTTRIGGWILIVILSTTALYLSYPRLDAYVNSRGYSVSNADLQAVRSIAKQTNKPYIVLANQQTSVASLKELGFDHYFKTDNEEIFFYPIPTGGKLYQYYLDMVDNTPSRDTMKKAMDLVGVKESYFVVSKYWWLSNRIIGQAKINADTYWEINGGDIYVFKFNY